MKTIREWIDTFPPYYRDRAISALNISQEEEDLLFKNAYDALCTAFIWDDTKQGHYFWAEFSEQLKF